MGRAIYIESCHGVTGDVEHSGTIADFREANAEDVECMEALDRLERGETHEELVGLNRLRIARCKVSPMEAFGARVLEILRAYTDERAFWKIAEHSPGPAAIAIKAAARSLGLLGEVTP